MNAVGLDLSLTSTGYARADGTTGTIKTADLRGPRRLVKIRTEILPLVHGADIVAIEGYSFGSRASHAHALGELGGVIRVALFATGIPYVEISPAALKKYATGNGRADKAAVLVAAVRRLGYQGYEDDEADALWLQTMTLDHYGKPNGIGEYAPLLPAKHREALDKIDWPTLSTTPAQPAPSSTT